MPRQHNRDRVADRHRDQRSGPVADAVLAVKIAIDFVGGNFLLREEIIVGDEARMIESDDARQVEIEFAPSLSQKNSHQLVIFDRIDRACVAIPHAEQKAAVPADRCTEFAKQGWPKRGDKSGLINAIDQTFRIN